MRTHAAVLQVQSVTYLSVEQAAIHISVTDTVVSVTCRHRTPSQREALTSVYAVLHNAMRYIYMYTCTCVL